MMRDLDEDYADAIQVVIRKKTVWVMRDARTVLHSGRCCFVRYKSVWSDFAGSK